jgi:hypothetical protein
MASRVDGGYAVITVGQFANVCAARKSGLISFVALRVWLAAHEQRAKRCTARGRISYTVRELARLVRIPEASAKRALAELSRFSLLTWSETIIEFPQVLLGISEEIASRLGTKPTRPVPVPRYVLRALFRHTRPSEVMAAIGHLIRCLFRRGREIVAYGLVKASWIASVFGVGERSVHAARSWMIENKFLTQEVVNQFVLNRWGGKFVVCLTQAAKAGRGAPKSAPPSLTKRTLKSTYSNQKINNKPGFAGKLSGVGTDTLGRPTIRNILPEDLRQLPRLEALYRQAVAANWLSHSEANLRNFVSAALRATRAGGRVGAIFAGIVKKKLWHHITQEQEDRALDLLRRHRDRRAGAFSLMHSTNANSGAVGKVSELLQTVMNCSSLLPGRCALSTVPHQSARSDCDKKMSIVPCGKSCRDRNAR